MCKKKCDLVRNNGIFVEKVCDTVPNLCFFMVDLVQYRTF